MEVSREGQPGGVQPGESSGRPGTPHQGVQQQGLQQQGVQQGTQRGGSLSQPQASLLPAFFANPGLMASAFMANPFEFAEVMSREMDRIFENFGPGSAEFGPGAGRQLRAGTGRSGAPVQGQAGQQRLARGGQRFMPQIELLQRGNELVVRADLPGVRPEDVDVEIEQGALIISGERRNEFEDQGQGFYRSERHYGSFHRAIPLPEGVNEDQIRAAYNHGVLEVTVPLPQQQQPRARRIQIQSAANAGAGAVAAGSSAGQSTGASSGAAGAPRSGADAGRDIRSQG